MNLSAEQRRAVECGEPHKRVIAVAGSGKTRVLVAQVGQWLSQGVSPDSLIAITFTRRAGEELRQRIWNRYNVRPGYVGTIHGMSYLALALAHDGVYRMTPLTDVECDAVVDHVARVCRLKSAVCPKVYKASRGEAVGPMDRPGSQALYRRVQDYMAAGSLIPVGDLVEHFGRQMAVYTDLWQWFTQHAATICWDEYQDTTRAEARLLDLAMPERSLVVGDPQQAIYGFRGADDRHLRQRTCSTYTIAYTFRLAVSIACVANRLTPKGVRLVPFREEPGMVCFQHQADPNPVSNAALQAIYDACQQAPTHVLCRTNREVAAITEYLCYMGLKAVAASPAFDRYSQPPWPKLFLLARHVMQPDCEWLLDRIDAGTKSVLRGDPEQPEMEMSMGELCCRWSPEIGQMVSHEAVSSLTPIEFVRWYMRRDLDDMQPAAGEADVIVMTAHAAKGSEFESVVVPAIGHSMAKNDDEGEEMNLLYVAMTRARNRLTLIGSGPIFDKLRDSGQEES